MVSERFQDANAEIISRSELLQVTYRLRRKSKGLVSGIQDNDCLAIVMVTKSVALQLDEPWLGVS